VLKRAPLLGLMLGLMLGQVVRIVRNA